MFSILKFLSPWRKFSHEILTPQTYSLSLTKQALDLNLRLKGPKTDNTPVIVFFFFTALSATPKIPVAMPPKQFKVKLSLVISGKDASDSIPMISNVTCLRMRLEERLVIILPDWLLDIDDISYIQHNDK